MGHIAENVNTPAKAVFITNAGPDIGGGHLSRSFALSQALEESGAGSAWILNDAAAVQAEKLSLKGVTYLKKPFEHDLSPYLAGADFAVIDSYLPDAGFYEKIAQCLPVVVIDDLADRGVERCSSVLINYGVTASPELYEKSASLFLLGPQYALLRKDFWSAAPETGAYVVFVAGASDVLNASETIIRLWKDNWPELLVVLGALVDRRRAAQIESDAYVLSNVHVKIAPDDFVDLLAGAGGVICSASVTAYEALALKKRVAVFSAADNQSGLGRILHGMKTAYDLGDWRMADENSIRGFFSFDPDIVKLSGLVNPRGALKCAEELLRGLSCLLKSGDRWDVLR